MTIELGHKALAEAHNLGIGLALRVKVGAALAAAHGERGQGVFQDLLKAEELDHGEVHAGVEAKPALIGADGRIVLDAVAAVDLDIAVVVHPGNTEFHHALRLDKALKKGRLFPFRVLVNDQLKRLEDFSDSLEEFRLMGVTLFDVGIDFLQIFVCNHRFLLVNNR